jgi:hypothetical protein
VKDNFALFVSNRHALRSDDSVDEGKARVILVKAGLESRRRRVTGRDEGEVAYGAASTVLVAQNALGGPRLVRFGRD